MLFEFPYIPEKPVQSLCFMKHKIISVCKFVNYVHIDLFFSSLKKIFVCPQCYFSLATSGLMQLYVSFQSFMFY